MAPTTVSRRQFLTGSALLGASTLWPSGALAQARPAGLAPPAAQDIAFVNGRIHTMDRARRVVSQLLIRNGRFAAVGDRVPRRDARVIDLKGRTVIPGIIDAHDHIVLVGNRPGWHVLAEDVFTVPDAVARYQARAAALPPR